MIGVLVSGTGTNLQALLDAGLPVVAVASNRAEAPALARAGEIPTAAFELGDYASRSERDATMAEWLRDHDVRLVVLAGYMHLLTPAFLDRFPNAVVNVHPSLLPAFPGLHAIEQALDYGVKVFGVTVHFVDDGCDTGPVILQRAIDLPGALAVEQVLAALRPLEHSLLPDAVRLFARGALGPDPANPRRIEIDASARSSSS
jgi:phosphoribosylglycinamide formyltransferase-1